MRAEERIRTLADAVAEHARAQPERRACTFLADGETESAALTYRELGARAASVASALARAREPGERALLLYPDGLDFVVGFLGCVDAGVVAVPSTPPDPLRLGRTAPRLASIARDSGASAVLTSSAIYALRERLLEHAPGLAEIEWIVTDEIPVTDATRPALPRCAGDACFIQYTSGSTGAPKGVVVSHGNLHHNEAVCRAWWHTGEDTVCVLWLPVFHDMGLVGHLLQTLVPGGHCVLMPPVAFLQRPFRWPAALSKYRATLSGGPNFGFDLAVRKTSAEARTGLDLSSLKALYNGAEPVRTGTVERFLHAFEPHGLSPDAFSSSYGLAEATLAVSGNRLPGRAVIRELDAAALEQSRVAPPSGGATRRLVSVGPPLDHQRLLIVDPETRTERAEGEFGEIWISGPHVCLGYWNRPDQTEETFGARLAGGDGPFLRTGDLGFMDRGELFIAGRLKDVIIIRGRNHAPQDVEATVEAVDPALRPGCGAAFPIEAGGEERLAVVQEVSARDGLDLDELLARIGEAIAREHQLSAHSVVLIAPRTLPKTSSGKVQRRRTREQLLASELEVVARWDAGPEVEAEVTEPPARSARRIEHWIVARLAAELGVSEARIDPRQAFERLGLDSARGVGLAGELEQWLGRTISPTAVWEQPSIRALAESLAAPTERLESESPSAARAHEVAIIGIGCRFPGAPDPDAFYELLCGSESAIREIPRDRTALAPLAREFEASGGRRGTKWGGFLDGVDRFDAEFFDISPREAATMDPQQRLLLEVTHEALEDAGLATEAPSAARTGVFVGVSAMDYAFLELERAAPIDAYFGTGTALSIAANRISYAMGFRGPSLTVDTACSSSLVAIHLACESLRDGTCDVAVAGGANLLLAPAISLGMSQTGALSPDGRCKTFSEKADGYVRSEGVGVVVLKPLDRALADGDRVYAVVRGGAVNNDGASNGLMAPSPRAQVEVLRAAYRAAGVDPSTVRYVEAHGTGTRLGDPIEARALGAVVGTGSGRDASCAIGSVKTHIGHAEAAAGVAGLIKVALALKRRRLPESLYARPTSSLIDFDALGLRVQTELGPWPAGAGALRAGVSSFGFGGTNCHVVLEEAPSPPDAVVPEAGPRFVVPLSARTPAALAALAGRYADWLERERPDLGRVAFVAGEKRAHRAVRRAFVSDTSEGLRVQLAQLDPAELAEAAAPRPQGRVGLIFSGYGSHWAGMAADLLERDRAFREAAEACDTALCRWTGRSVLDALRAAPPHETHRIDRVQEQVFVVQVALARALQAWGIEVSAVMGHSAGEVAAAHVAGALSLHDAARVMAERGAALLASSGSGRTAFVACPGAECEALFPAPGALAVAAHNGPRATVVAGPEAELDAFLDRAERRGHFARRLALDFGAHSAGIEPWLDAVRLALSDLRPRPPEIPMYSTAEGRWVEGKPLDADYWCANLRQPVRFWDGVAAWTDDCLDVLVEVSPHPVLVPGLREGLLESGASGVEAFGTLQRDGSGEADLLACVAAVYEAGGTVDWSRQRPAGAAAAVDGAPRYPWQRRSFWVPAGAAVARMRPPESTLIGDATASSWSPGERFWAVPAGALAAAAWRDHRVGGRVAFPAAGFASMACAAAAEVHPGAMPSISELVIEAPLFLDGDELPQVQVALRSDGDGRDALQVASRRGDGGWQVHAAAKVTGEPPAPGAWTVEAVRAECGREVPAAALYAAFAESRLEYGPQFQRVGRLWCGDGVAVARLDPADAADPIASPVAILDAALQCLAGVRPEAESGAPYLPVAIEALALDLAPPADTLWCRATRRPGDADDRLELAGDIDVQDGAGRTVATVRGLRARRLADAPRAPLDSMLFELAWRPEVGAAEPAGPPGPCLLLGGPAALRSALAEGLRAAGANVIEPTAEQLPDGPVELVYLDALSSRPTAGLDSDWLAAHAADSSFGLVTALGSLRDERDLRLTVVTRGAHAIGSERAGLEVAQAPLWPLARAIGLERPELAPRLVDLDPDAPLVSVAPLVAELGRSERNTEVCLRGAARHAARLVRATLDGAPAAPGPALRGDRTYLVTGGFGALGLATSDWLAARGARALALVGRTGAGAGRPRIDALRDRGVHVTAHCADVADANAVSRVVEALEAGERPLGGVIHLAGVLADATLDTVERAAFDRVFAPKVVGAWNLHLATRSAELDFFVLVSSLASLLGSPGQAGYSAANGFLDALAAHRIRSGLPAASVCYGPWDRIGRAVAAGGPSHLTRRGVLPLAPDDALEALGKVLERPRCALGVARFDPGRWIESFPSVRSWPLLDEVRPAGRPGIPESGIRASLLRAADAADRETLLQAFLAREVAGVLHRPVSEIDPRLPFRDLGVDSLMGLELRSRVERALGLELPSIVVFAQPTVPALAKELLARLEPGTPAAAPEPAAASESELRAMSERDAEALLERKLSALDPEG